MDEHDKNNLEFLLSADEKTLLDWYNNTNYDDHLYASELMSKYSEELTDIKVSMDIELHLLNNDTDEWHESNNILSKFSIK